jgi:uncharacterized protein (TIGR02186 family)
MVERPSWRTIASVMAGLGVAVLVLGAGETMAQRRKGPAVAKEVPHSGAAEVRRSQQPGARESVQADVSARNIAVTSSFTGTEIVIFGAVDNSQQPSSESGYYDIIIVVAGVPGPLVVRRKNNVAGLWLNTSSAIFDNVPSYYGLASTRPIEEIAPEQFRRDNGVGMNFIKFTPAPMQKNPLSSEDVEEFRRAVVRLKRKQNLYLEDQYAVGFVGKSLFRASIVLPANVTVGPFETRVYLFREEQHLGDYTVRLNLEREGLERHLHAFAFRFPTLYGLMTVMIAVAAGLAASQVFRKNGH